MARPSKQYPTEGELEVLQVIWDHGPSTVQDIVANLNRRQDDHVTYASVLSLVTVMHSKNLLTRWKSGRKHVYQAMIGRGETLQAILGKLFGIAFAGMPTEVAMHFLNRDHSISEAELTTMRQILAKVKNDESPDRS
jgi:BlaI family transcriptional regulator, penicillinase repressor